MGDVPVVVVCNGAVNVLVWGMSLRSLVGLNDKTAEM